MFFEEGKFDFMICLCLHVIVCVRYIVMYAVTISVTMCNLFDC